MAPASTAAPLVSPAPVVQLWPAAPASVPQARHALRAVLVGWGLGGLGDEAEVVLAELLTNAVEHAAGGPVGTRLLRRGRGGVRLEVWDGDAYRLPALGKAGEEQVRGRGLQIVDAVTRHAWGVATREGQPGKVVWAHIGGEVEESAPYCHASVRLGPGLTSQVLALGARIAPDLVAATLLCYLEARHLGGHVALAYDHLDGPDAGAVWARWEEGETRARAICVLPDCPALGPGDVGGCSLFAAHPGRHTWEWEA
ncbi:ATP-binding protein [Actinacidiphila epipremni]|uniref:ATP-binding protein n=1 Tax=Actinacidiphila epipremni TaxID=2053013 RepID=UPI001F0D4625